MDASCGGKGLLFILFFRSGGRVVAIGKALGRAIGILGRGVKLRYMFVFDVCRCDLHSTTKSSDAFSIQARKVVDLSKLHWDRSGRGASWGGSFSTIEVESSGLRSCSKPSRAVCDGLGSPLKKHGTPVVDWPDKLLSWLQRSRAWWNASLRSARGAERASAGEPVSCRSPERS